MGPLRDAKEKHFSASSVTRPKWKTQMFEDIYYLRGKKEAKKSALSDTHTHTHTYIYILDGAFSI